MLQTISFDTMQCSVMMIAGLMMLFVKRRVMAQLKYKRRNCVNHVSKRMGAALRKSSAESKFQGRSISGREKLTQIKLTKIQTYYGRAIKVHADHLASMSF